MADIDDFLAHYGVKGMHWGVRSAANSEATPYKQARVDAKALKSAVKSDGTRSKSAQAARARIKERRNNDPAYKAAKAKYEDHVRRRQNVTIAAIGLGVIAGPYILDTIDAAFNSYAQNNVEKSLHDVTYKSFEKSAYGQRRREQGRNFVDNTNHRVVGPDVSSTVARRN